jgi:hypothetical protein
MLAMLVDHGLNWALQPTPGSGIADFTEEQICSSVFVRFKG